MTAAAASSFELCARGPGAPVAMLHGFLGAPSMWRPVLDALGPAVAARPVALATLPGHGLAPWAPEGAAFDDVVDALARELGRLDARPWVLVGYSMGARLALALAMRHPARAAVLIGGDPGLTGEDERAARRAWDDGQAARLLERGVPAFVAEWEALPLFATQAAMPAAARAAQRAAREAHTARGLAWAMRAMGLGRMPPQWEALAATRVPLYVVTGASDAKFTALGRRIAQTTPRAAHRVVDGAGHNVALEAPRAVAAAVRRALDDDDARSEERAQEPWQP